MSAVQEAIGQRERALRRLFRWSSCWPLLAMPTSLIVYVLVVLACDLALIGWELAATPIRTGDLLLFCALLAAAVICIEAMRRLGQVRGDRDGERVHHGEYDGAGDRGQHHRGTGQPRP